MSNPDLDIRYLLPDRIEEYAEGLALDGLQHHLYHIHG